LTRVNPVWLQRRASNGRARGFGLLTGIDVESELAMNSTDDVQWLWEPGLLWEAATKDANVQNISTSDYLELVRGAMIKFRESGEVHDREVFYQFLEEVHK
jgi:hypothetical protein